MRAREHSDLVAALRKAERMGPRADGPGTWHCACGSHGVRRLPVYGSGDAYDSDVQPVHVYGCPIAEALSLLGEPVEVVLKRKVEVSPVFERTEAHTALYRGLRVALDWFEHFDVNPTPLADVVALFALACGHWRDMYMPVVRILRAEGWVKPGVDGVVPGQSRTRAGMAVELLSRIADGLRTPGWRYRVSVEPFNEYGALPAAAYPTEPVAEVTHG